MAHAFPQLCRAFSVAVVLTMSSLGCYRTTHQPLKPNASLVDAIGVFTRPGEEILFAVPGATLTNDTLFATGTTGAVKIPIDSVGSITRHGFSPWSSLVVVGIAAAAALALLAVDLANANWGS